MSAATPSRIIPTYTVVAARSRAKQLKQEIEKGHDPLAKKQADREAATMADLAARYIEEHGPEKRASSLEDDREHDRAGHPARPGAPHEGR